jgi:hypothetical protein
VRGGALASAPVIRIELTDEDLGRTRLALSPLWELVASLFWLHKEEPTPEYAPWVARTRRALRGVDLGPLNLDIEFPKYVPDFAAPIPVDPLPTLAAEIEGVRGTDTAVILADIAAGWGDAPPPPWDAFVAHPREMVDRLADAMHAYWDAALADEWPRLRALLEGEMLARARALALSGPTAVLEELHPSLRWRRPAIELYKEKNYDMHLEGRPLVLIPLVFARDVLMGVSEGQRAVAIGYQARGTAALWAPDTIVDDGRLTCSSAMGAPRCCAPLGDRPRPPSSRAG